MTPEQIKAEADKITAQYAVYANGLVDGNLHKFSSTHCAILHVEACSYVCELLFQKVEHNSERVCIELKHHYKSLLQELKSRV